jgi:DNA-binding winged helix-turn-helix (wHTH) protein
MHRASNPLNADEAPVVLALRFGPLELDVRSGEMRRNGVVAARLQPQPLKVLLLLAGREGDVVTREEIQAEVWPAGTFVDFEQSLNFCIRQIRSALGDNANAPRYVETLPRRGYRWVGGAVDRVTGGVTVREWPRPVPATPAMEATQEAAPVAAEPPAPRRAPWLVPVAALLLAAGGGLAAWRWLPRPARAEPPTFERLTFRRGSVGAARFGPGGQVVYAAAWDGAPLVVQVTDPESRDARSLSIENASVVAVSAEGEVAFLHGGVLARAPLSGGPPKEVQKGVVAADWARDGGELALVRSSPKGLVVEWPAGREIASVARASRIRISPDGRHVAIAEHPFPDDDRGLVAVLDRTGRRVAASAEWASLEGIAWAGAEVLFTASAVGADNSVHALSLDGRVRPVLSGMGRLVVHDVAPDGRVLLERTTLRAEVLYRGPGAAEDRELSWLDFSAVEAIAPDGGTILFYESGQGGGKGYSTFLRKGDGSAPVRVGSGRALDLSPDERWVLSVSVDSRDHLDLTPTGPGEEREVRVAGLATHQEAGFVGADRLFVTGTDASGRRATFVSNLDGSGARPLPLPEGHALGLDTFSPDGRRFVASCPEKGRLCLYDTDAGQPEPVPGVKPGWWPVGLDARGRLFLRDRTRRVPETLVRLDPASGTAVALAELAPRDRAGVTGLLGVQVAASGDAWAYTVARRLSDLHVVSGLN